MLTSGDGRQRGISEHGISFHAIAGIIGQPPTGDLIEVEVAKHGVQLPKARAVSLLRPRLQRQRIIILKPSDFPCRFGGDLATVSRRCSSRRPANNC